MLDQFTKFLPKRSIPIIGVDIGTGSVKVVELKKEKGTFSLHKVGVSYLADGMVKDGVVADPGGVAAKIQEAVAASGTTVKNVVSSLAGSNVISRYVDFPKMPKAELKEAIKWEAEKYIPLPPDEVYMDAEIASAPAEGDSMKVLLVAAPKEMIEGHYKALEMAGLIPTVIDLQALALARALLGEAETKPAVIVDIGSSATKVAIFSEGVMIFNRSIPLGGNRITTLMMNTLGISWLEAENYKQRPNFLEQLSDSDLKREITLLLNDIRREVRRSVEYFISRDKDISISNFVVTGGTAMLPDMTTSVAAEVGIKVRIGNPFDGIMRAGSAFDPQFIANRGAILTVAAGLAMREVGDHD